MDSKAASPHSCDQWIYNAFKSLLALLDANKFLIGVLLIIACFRHESALKNEMGSQKLFSPPEICTQRNLTRFSESRDYDAMRRMADACGSTGLAVEARVALHAWDNEDWRRARSALTIEAFRRYIRTWEYDGAYLDEARMAIESLAMRRRTAAPSAAGLDYCSFREAEPVSTSRREFFVQVFSSRTLDRAAYTRNAIARRYASVLGSCNAEVQSIRSRYDGELHRVVIGPIQTRLTAQTLCQELRQKGLEDCTAIQ
jgi:hypothetical protein